MFAQKELLVIISLINDYQSDGARWTIDGVDLTELRKKIEKEYERVSVRNTQQPA